MADLSITAANVLKGSGAKLITGTAGATITAGQVVYLDSADDEYKLADCDSATAAVRTPAGIALHASLDGQPLTILTKGPITIGATIAAGVAYYLSATAGGICPVADLSSGDYPAVLGMGESTTVLEVDIQAPGVALA